jgi:hypothetical protein
MSQRAVFVAALILIGSCLAVAPASAQVTVKAALLDQSVDVPNGWGGNLTFSASVLDTSGWWNASAPTRLTVPSGVNYVQVSASIDLGYQCSVCEIYLMENDTSVVGVSYGATANTGFGDTTFTVLASVVQVSAGNYFTVRVYQNSGGTLNVPVHFAIVTLDTGAQANGTTLKTAAINQLTTVPDGWGGNLTFSTTAFDSGGWWNASAPARLTVPSGVHYVQVVATVQLPYTCTVCEIYVVQNDVAGVGTSYGATANTGFGAANFTVIAPVLAVNAGDYFTVRVYQNNGSALSAPVQFSVLGLDPGAASGISLKTAALNQSVSILNQSGGNLVFASAPVFDTAGFWSATAPDRITIAAPGYVQLTASMQVPYQCTMCEIYLVENNATYVAWSYGATANTGFGAATYTAFSSVVPVAAGDYFTVRAYQNSGNAVNAPVQFSVVALDTEAAGNWTPFVDHVIVTPVAPTLSLFGTQTLTAQAYSATNQLLSGVSFAWTTSDGSTLPITASTTTTATVTARLMGSATISARSTYATTGTATVTVGPPATMIVYDRFSGSDNTAVTAHLPDYAAAGGTWTTWGFPSVVLRNGRVSAGYQDSTYGSTVTVIDAGTPNGVIGVDWWPVNVGTNAPNGIGGIAFRVQDGQNYWVAASGFYGYGLSLYKVINGNWTTVVVGPDAPLAPGGHRLEVRLTGASIEVWSDNARKIQLTDSYNQTQTRHGLYLLPNWDWLSTFDNFTISTGIAAAIDHVIITPPSSTVVLGGPQSFVATAYDSTNAVIPNVLFHWTTSSTRARVATAAYYASGATAWGLSEATTVTATPAYGPAGSASIAIDSSRVLVFDSFTGSSPAAVASHVPDLVTSGSRWWTWGYPSMQVRDGHLVPAGQDTTYGPTGVVLDTGASDAIISVDWSPVGAGTLTPAGLGGITFRAQDDGNYWVAASGMSGTGPALYKVIDYDWYTVATGSSSQLTPGVTHRLEVRLQGPSIQFWCDGVLQVQTTDAFNQLQTQHGLHLQPDWDWLSTFDNLTVMENVSSTIDHVVVTPPTTTVTLGGAQIFTAQAFTASNQPIGGVLFRWFISDGTAASPFVPSYYSSWLTLSGVQRNVTVSALAIGGATGSASVTVDASHVLVYDGFTAGDGVLIANHAPDVAPTGSAWTVNGFPQMLVRGQRFAQSVPESTYMNMEAAIDSGATDGVIGVDWWPAGVGTAAGHPIGGLLFRYRDAGNYWVAGSGIYGYGLSLWKVQNWAWTQVATSNVVPVQQQPHRLEVHLTGPNIEVWWDGVRQMQAVDAVGAASSIHGIFMLTNWEWLSTFDNFSVVGSPRCVSPIDPSAITVAAGGTTGTITLSATPSCSWSSFSDASWISLLAPLSGTGNGSITYVASANNTAPNTNGSTRTGTIIAGGRALVVTQPPLPDPCFLSIFPSGTTFPADGGRGRFPVTVSMTACEWIESTETDWLLPLRTFNTGSGWAEYAVGRNDTGSDRSNVLWINGLAFAVTQTAQFQGSLRIDDPGCFNGVFPNRAAFAGDGGSGGITVSAPSDCSWTASSDKSWVTLAQTSGSGDFMLGYVVAPNADAASRTATVTVGNATFTITQDVAGTSGGGGGSGNCIQAVSPQLISIGSNGGSGTVSVTAPAGCSWSVTSQADWLVANGGGSGSGIMTYSASPNSSAHSRLGKVTIGNQSITFGELATNQNPSCTQQPNGNELSVDNTAAIQCLLDLGGTVTLDADVLYGYHIGIHGTGLHLTQSNTTLTSNSAYGYKALLFADPYLHTPILTVAPGVVYYTIDHIWFYGNRFERVCDDSPPDRNRNANLSLDGYQFTIDSVESDAAPCGSSTIVPASAHDFTVSNSWFANNGWPLRYDLDPAGGPEPGQGAEPWSDGMTVLRCVNGKVFGNHFQDNTDVDLVLGGVPTPDNPNATCEVHDNTVTHYQAHGFAAIMEECFPNGVPANGDGHFENATIWNNTISSTVDELAFGLMVGRHPWGTVQACQVSDAGHVYSNTSTGAVVNLAVDGIASGSVGPNSTNGAQGDHGFETCRKSADYTAAHFGAAQLSASFITRFYDNGSCPD